MATIIGDRIRQAREMKGITQTQLARESGVHQPSMSFYETGMRTPGIKVLHRIAKVLEISMDFLLGYIDKPSSIGRLGTFLGHSNGSKGKVKSKSTKGSTKC